MDTNGGFVYLSVIEGLIICAMLAWEIFWLRRMYQVLHKLVDSFEPLKGMVMGLAGSFIGRNNKP